MTTERARRVLQGIAPGRGVAFLSFTQAAVLELDPAQAGGVAAHARLSELYRHVCQLRLAVPGCAVSPQGLRGTPSPVRRHHPSSDQAVQWRSRFAAILFLPTDWCGL